MRQQRLYLFPLLQKYRGQTTGNAVASPKYTELEVPDFRPILAYATELWLFSSVEQATTNFQWGVYFTSGFDRSAELSTGPFRIGALVSATDPPTRHAAYTTTTNFLLESRVFLGTGNSSGSANESGLCSAVLGVLTVGM